jgi:hypothetical protein
MKKDFLISVPASLILIDFDIALGGNVSNPKKSVLTVGPRY